MYIINVKLQSLPPLCAMWSHCRQWYAVIFSSFTLCAMDGKVDGKVDETGKKDPKYTAIYIEIEAKR